MSELFSRFLQERGGSQQVQQAQDQPAPEGLFANFLQERAQSGKAAIDTDTGAPARIRAAVGSATTPQDRLSTLQQYFPDAAPAADTPGNFVFTNPQTGQPTLYNPKGLDRGDFASIGPEIGEAVGGAVGAVGGAVTGAFAGPIGAGVGGVTGAGIGSAAGREAAIQGLNKIFDANDTRTAGEIGEQALEAAAWGAGGQAVLGLAGKGIKALYRSTIAPTISREGFQAAAQAGATPTVGQTLGGGAAAIERTLSQSPFSGAPLRATADIQADALRGAIRNIAGSISESGIRLQKDEAGQQLINGVMKAITRASKVREFVYERALKDVPANTPFVPNKSLELSARIASEFADNPAAQDLANTGLFKELQSLVSKPLTFSGAKSLKGRIFKRFEQAQREGNLNLADDLFAFYKAFDEDIVETAAATNPAVAGSLKQADGIAQKTYRLEENLKKFITGSAEKTPKNPKNLKVPEAVFDSFIRKASAQGSADIGTLRVLKKRLPREQFKEVAAYMLDNLGLERVGAEGVERGFSPRSFVTRWKKVSPEARQILFESTLGKDQYRALNHLVDASDSLARLPLNPSGTAANVADFASLGALATGVGGLATGAGSGGAVLLAAFAPRLIAGTTTSATLAKGLNRLPRAILAKPYSKELKIKILASIAAATGGHHTGESVREARQILDAIPQQ